MYYLRLLGSLSLEDPSGSNAASLVRQRPLAVLALLAVAREKGCSRDKLIGYLWPEIEQDRARHRLTDSVYLLRKSLGEDVLLAAGDTLRLNPEVVEVDAAGFLDALDSNALEAAVEFYEGPFLDGFYMSGVPEFERWVESERQRFADACADAVEELAEGSERAEDYRLAVNWWKRLAAHDPYNSRYALRLMQALAAAGDRGNALQFAQEHERRLSEELGIEPDEEFYAFVERLRNEAGRELQPSGNVALEGDSGGSHAEPSHWLTSPNEPANRARSVDAVVAADEAHLLIPRGEVGRFRRLLTGRGAIIGGATAIGLLGIVVSGYMAMRVMGIGPWGTLIGRGVLEERDVIVLADFENNSGDSILALAVTEAMRVRLEQSRVVKVADDSYVGGVLERMERDPDALLTAELAREMAVREGLKAVVTGQINEVGRGYMLSSRLVASETGETLESFLETAPDPDAIIPAIDRLSAAMRGRIGESLRTVRSSPPLSQVRTASLEALRFFTEATRANARQDMRRSLDLVNRALEIDTLFASAYRLRANQLSILGENRTQRIADATRAFQLRDRLPLIERYRIEALYHETVTGDMEEAIRAYRAELELYPDSRVLNNVALIYMDLRQYARAEEALSRLLEVDSLALHAYHNLSRTQFNLGKPEEAEATLDRCEEVLPGDPYIDRIRARYAAARGDYDAAAVHLREWANVRTEDQPRQAYFGLHMANVVQVQGRLAEAESFLSDAMAIFDRRGAASSYLSTVSELAGLRLWFLGDTIRALEMLARALERYPLDSITPTERPYAVLAVTYAFAGEPERARELVAEWDTAVPFELRRVGDYVRHIVLGVVALAEGRNEEALREFGIFHERSTCPMCTLPLIGHTHHLDGQADSAVALYERYLATPYYARTIGGTSPASGRDPYWLPVVYERLGKLYEQRGDTAKAIHYYGKFADLWKDADPALQPRVEAARRVIEALSPGT